MIARRDCGFFDTSLLRPRCCAERLPMPRYHQIAASVSALFFRSCPPAVFWLVVAIVVWITVYGLAFRTVAHVGKEVCKNKPAITNTNTSAAVATVATVAFVVAAASHPDPCLVCAGASCLACTSVRSCLALLCRMKLRHDSLLPSGLRSEQRLVLKHGRCSHYIGTVIH